MAFQSLDRHFHVGPSVRGLSGAAQARYSVEIISSVCPNRPRGAVRMKPPQKMGPSEALVETLAANGVTHVFGIVGSAFMDALDIFPAAGIRFVPVAHEQGAIHMADGYARASGRHGVCIAQNGPGVTNFVTGVAAAYWAHSPVVFITPETRLDDHGTRRLSGDRAAADLLEDHQVPGARQQSEAHGGDRRALLRSRHARDGADAAQHSARLLLRRDRGDHRRADAHQPGSGRCGGARAGGRTARRCELPGDRRGRRRDQCRCHGRGDRAGGAARRAGVQQLPAQRLLSRLPCALPSGRSATRARRPP